MATSDFHTPAVLSEPPLTPAVGVEVPIPLPPPGAPSRRTPSVRWGRVLEVALVGVVLLFGFLAASFVARNSDLWQHLAAGRLFARGDYKFGVDPFAYTTQGVYWVNHSWLLDWFLYGVFNAVGGAGLVVLKALVVVALAWVLLHIRQPLTPTPLPRGERGWGEGNAARNNSTPTQASTSTPTSSL